MRRFLLVVQSTFFSRDVRLAVQSYHSVIFWTQTDKFINKNRWNWFLRGRKETMYNRVLNVLLPCLCTLTKQQCLEKDYRAKRYKTWKSGCSQNRYLKSFGHCQNKGLVRCLKMSNATSFQESVSTKAARYKKRQSVCAATTMLFVKRDKFWSLQ